MSEKALYCRQTGRYSLERRGGKSVSRLSFSTPGGVRKEEKASRFQLYMDIVVLNGIYIVLAATPVSSLDTFHARLSLHPSQQ